MDRKSITIVALCFVLILAWQPLTRKFYPTPPEPPPSAAGTNVGTNTGTNTPLLSAGTNAQPVAQVLATTVSTTVSKFVTRKEVTYPVFILTNSVARYTFTSRGGGLEEVQLLKYSDIVRSRRTKQGDPAQQYASLNSPAVPPVFALVGDEALQGDNAYTLTPIANGVRAEKTLASGLTVIKDFQLGTNYLVIASVRFENRSKQPLLIPSYQWIAGVATPMGPQDNAMAESVMWYNGSKVDNGVLLPYFNTNTTSWGVFTHVPKTEYLTGSSNIVWASSQNQFFTLATMADKPASEMVVHMVDLVPPTAEEIKEFPNTRRDPKGLLTALIYPGLKLDPGAVVTNQFNLFAGPKEYQTLAHLAARFNNEIDQVMGFGWSWTSPISKALLVTMNWLHLSIGLSYGLLIILITFCIKLIFWPLTQAATRSSKRMQALQPQVKALQEKYKDEPQKFTSKQWELYRQNKVNPASGCLPMLIQVPVFIGFYGMLRTAIELRGAPFLWIGDLSNPDTVASIFLPFHFLGFSDAYFPINPMPLIMGVTLLIQAQFAPAAPSMDPAQQQMMKYMPLLMLVFMYNLSSGLALYWTVNNMLTIVQTKLTKMQADPTTPAPPAAKASGPPQKKKK